MRILYLLLSVVIFFIVYFAIQNISDDIVYELNINDIFADKAQSLITNDKNIITVISGGDVNLANEINNLSRFSLKNFHLPF